jgi:hypothetical protein
LCREAQLRPVPASVPSYLSRCLFSNKTLLNHAKCYSISSALSKLHRPSASDDKACVSHYRSPACPTIAQRTSGLLFFASTSTRTATFAFPVSLFPTNIIPQTSQLLLFPRVAASPTPRWPECTVHECMNPRGQNRDGGRLRKRHCCLLYYSLSGLKGGKRESDHNERCTMIVSQVVFVDVNFHGTSALLLTSLSLP